MMRKRVEEIRRLAKELPSKAAILRALGYKPLAGNYGTLERVAKANGIELPDGTGTAIASDRKRKSLDEILVEHSTFNRYHLKARLIKDGVLENKCSAPYCPVPNPSIDPFTGKPCELKLSLDHINGINNDNRIENLRLLCYHCHGMTETYCNSKR